MFIIIEGLDRSGKSTLSEEISKIFGFKVVHCSKPKTNDPYKEYVDLFKEYDGQNVVFDRFYLGEYVYSNLYRGGCPITDFQFWVLDMMAQKNTSLLIYSKTDLEVIYNRCVLTNESVDDFNYKTDLEKAHGLFNEVIFNKTFLTPIIYDSNKDTPDQFLNSRQSRQIREILADNKQHKINNIDARSTGSPHAGIMVIGEQLGPTAIDNYSLPFQSGSSSEYLFSAIKESELKYSSVYFTNAYKPWISDIDKLGSTLRDEVSLVNPDVIIYLGKTAAALGSKYNIGKEKKNLLLPHPSYWKRFNHSKLKEYADMLSAGARIEATDRISYRI